MVHRHVAGDEALDPAYAGRFAGAPIPKNRMPDVESLPGAVYRMIHDELLLDGSSRLNMATFVTTWMEPEAVMLGGLARRSSIPNWRGTSGCRR